MAFPGGTLDEAYKRFKVPLVPFSLVATTAGNAAGTTIISSQLIGVADVVMNSCDIIIVSGAYKGFNAQVMAFDNTTGTLTLGDPMGAIIAAGTRFAVVPSDYDTIITGWTGAATATAVGALIERLQLLQQALINNNTIFTSSAATVNTVACATLIDRADLYEGMMLVPLGGNQAGQGRYITAYDGNDVLTVVPDWSTDPDAAGAFTFVIMPTPMKFAYEAGKGLSAIYDLVNGLPVLTRIYSDFDIQALTVEETVFEYDDAAYIWHPEWLVYHLDEAQAAEQFEIKIYEKDNDTDDNWRLMYHGDTTGVIAVPVIYVQLPPVDLAFKVTVEQTGGTLRDVVFKLYKES